MSMHGVTRRAFAQGLPAAVLAPAWLGLGLAGAAGSLCGCSAVPAASEDAADASGEEGGSHAPFAGLAWERGLALDYAGQFSADFYEGGFARVALADGTQALVVPEGAQAPAEVPEGTVVLRQPLERIYLVASQGMDYVRALDAVACVRFSGTSADKWYIPEAKAAMEAGEMLYAGKYSAPDYELIVDGGCDLAVENTMVYHTPEVKEQLEKLGVPVLVERSSYEAHPLGRMEWLKFYGVLLGREDQACSAFDDLVEDVRGVLDQPATGKTAAFFYVTANGAVNVHKPGDYIARCVELAGGSYLPQVDPDEDNALSTMNMQMEAFYAAAKDADCLVYNSTIDAELTRLDELVAKDGVLADFAAVKAGRVWCTGKDLFQEPLGLGNLILDLHAVLEDGDVPDDDLVYLHRLV